MNYLLIAIISIIYILNIYLIYDIFCNKKSIEYYTNEEYNYVHDTLYKNLKKSIELFEKHDLKHWATWGTLLGCIRDNKIIEHDDDVDLAMTTDGYNRLLDCIKKEDELFQEFKNAGLHLIENPAPWSQIKILTHRDDGDYSTNRIFIDIGHVKKTGDKLLTIVDDWKETEWYHCDDVENLSTGMLGDIEIKIPNNYISYLERTYGDCSSKEECWKIPKKEHDHEDEVNIKNIENI
jgi:hypothetical protein